VLDPGLNGRVALVTGANQGIGAATARALAAHGVAVLLTYLRLDPGVDQLSNAGIVSARTNGFTCWTDGVPKLATRAGVRSLDRLHRRAHS